MNRGLDHTSPYYYKIFQAVCNHKPEQFSRDLEESLDLYTGELEDYGGEWPLEYGGMSSLLNRLSNQFVQTYNENLAQNLERILKRMIQLEIKVVMNVNVTEDLLKKLSNHIYRRLCRLVTPWPRSVARTPRNKAICETVFTKFRICFLHLCPANQRRQFLYNRDANPNTGIHGYDNQVRAHPNQFLGIFFQASRYIEHVKNLVDQGHFIPAPNSLSTPPQDYLLRLFQSRLSWGQQGKPFPPRFQGKLIKKMKILIEEFKDLDELQFIDFDNPNDMFHMGTVAELRQRIMEVMRYNLERPDTFFEDRPRPSILSNDDVDYLVRLIIKISVWIHNDEFFPDRRVATSNTKMFNIVPQQSFVRGHIPIDRTTFHSFLSNSGFQDVPVQRRFMNNDLLAAEWYWRVFNFKRLKFPSLSHIFPGVAPQNKRFDFLIVTDGIAFTAHFTKPSMEEVDYKPQDVAALDLPDDTTYWFVDPGQINAFTAMEGLSGVEHEDAKRIIRFTTGEWYDLTGYNHTEQERHLKKRADFEEQVDREDTMIHLESNIPTSRTASLETYLESLRYVVPLLPTFFDYYNQDFNWWRLRNYTGKQKALTEVSLLHPPINSIRFIGFSWGNPSSSFACILIGREWMQMETMLCLAVKEGMPADIPW